MAVSYFPHQYTLTCCANLNSILNTTCEESIRMQVFISAMCLISVFFARSYSQYSLQSIITPENCFGGQICGIQPTVSVINSATRQIVYTFEGSVFVQLAASPSGYESLYYGKDCDLTSCGQLVVGSLVSATFISGVASFSGLMLKTAGTGYTLKYIGQMSAAYDQKLFAFTYSDPFSVSIGSPFQLVFLNNSFAGNAFGGSVFNPNPVVTVADRGGNTVVIPSASYIGKYIISASLTSTPHSPAADGEALLPTTSLNSVVSNGVATFQNLYIKKAGYPYRISFRINQLPLATLVSLPFTVAVGPAAQLAYVSGQLSSTTKYAGEFFLVPPKIKLMDKGGNIPDDYINAVQISIYGNPTGGEIGPSNSLFAVAKHGIVTFSALKVSKTGLNYTLLFSFCEYNSTYSNYSITSISLLSEKFHVLDGPARKLNLIVPADGAWAGNQAFSTQPVVQTVGYGDDYLLTDFSSIIESSIVQSLSVLKSLVVYTADAPTTVITNVSFSLTSGNYGTGQIVDIYVHFSADVWVQGLNSLQFSNLNSSMLSKIYSELAYIALNGNNKITGAPLFATLLASTELDVIEKNVLTFRYVVMAEDDAYPLDYLLETTSLTLNNSVIVDGNNREVSTILLPVGTLGAEQVIIDTNPPRVTQITTPIPDGEYGAGESIIIEIKFDFPVQVKGIPFIRLSAMVERPTSSPTIVPSDSPTKFMPSRPPSDPDPTETPTVQPSYKPSADPSLMPTEEPTVFPTLSPEIVAVFNSTVSPSYLPSSKPSSRPSSRPSAYPSYGYHSNAVAFYNSSSEDKTTLLFVYEVGLYDFTAKDEVLRISSTFIEFQNPRSNWVRRDANVPTTNAVLDFNPSTFISNIVIDASPPSLNSIYGVQTDHPDGTFYTGETIRLSVQFNKPIAAKGDAIYLILDCGVRLPGATYNGFAYIDKVLPDNVTIEFVYVVEEYVNTTSKAGIKFLDIESGGAALVVLSAQNAYIRRLSSSPTADADLYTDDVLFSTLSGSHFIEVFGFPPVVQEVSIVSTNPPAATLLQPDDSAIIEVRFSDPVIANCSPVFVVAVGYYYREAVFVAGNGTDTLQFKYTVLVGDYSNSTLQYRHTPYALCASSGCHYPTKCFILANSSSPVLPANLKLPRSGIRPYWTYTAGVNIGSLTIQRTRVGRNTSITSIVCTADPGEYGAGSVLRFEVTFSDIVELRTFPGSRKVFPLLRLNIIGALNNTERYAEYAGGSPGLVMDFIYVTQIDDYITSGGGDFVGAAFIAGDSAVTISTAIRCLRNDTCFFQNQAGQVIDLTISNSIIDASTYSAVYLNADAPVVTDVWSTKEVSLFDEEEYTVGEQINVYVNVSKPVSVTGFNPRILMDVNVSERYAIYNSLMSTESLLVFVYTVGAGDYSSNLAFKGDIDLYGGQSFIYRKSDVFVTLMDTSLSHLPKVLSSGGALRIDTSAVPKVLNVSFDGIGNGSYRGSFSSTIGLGFPTSRIAAGDIITIVVQMSMYVTAVGRSYLLLNTGDHTAKAMLLGYYSPFSGAAPTVYNASANATEVLAITRRSGEFGANTNILQFATGNYPTLPTKKLIYQYRVGYNDLASTLDYVDCFALYTGRKDSTEPGYIRRSSSKPFIDADLTLPVPGQPGSLSPYKLLVDGRAPYLSSIEFISPDGVYGVTQQILIAMNFSAAVVVRLGKPFLILDAGKLNGSAYYSSGSGTSTLIFEYLPQPGHYNTNLDYRCDTTFCSANASFVFNGAEILATSANPFVPAQIWLNPPQGVLIGSSSVNSFEGQGTFRDLGLRQRGPDYQLRFTRKSNAGTDSSRLDALEITTTQIISNSFSSEFEIRPKEALPSELIGYSVDISGDIAILGSPNTNRSVTTIQAVTSSAMQVSPQQEVQLITTSARPQPGIISFHSTADVGETVGGFFTLSYDINGPTAPIPANAETGMLHAILSYSLPGLGNVTVSRQPYIYCACLNAFTWKFTFNDINEGIFHSFTVDDSKLEGSGAAIADVILLQSASLLSGSFSLSLATPLTSVTSVSVPFDANYRQMEAAVTSLGLPVYNVEITPSQRTLGRSWLVTFNAYRDSYEIPLLIANNTGLTGASKTEVYTKIIQKGIHGPKGIAGYFQLEWRGNTTVPLPATATAEQVKDALEQLPVINFVNVNRSRPSVINGYTWTIEFVSVNRNTSRGYELQDTENLEPIIPINHLIATNASLVVQALWLGINQSFHLYDIARQGTYGSGAGAVYVFQRRKEQWNQVASIVGNDTAENSRFGHSVAIIDDVLIVGSIGANLNGVPEKQAITCFAKSGFFQIEFRGWSTDPISFNVTREGLIDAIVNVPGTFQHLYPVFSIAIDDWGSGGLCENNNTATITFYSPLEGTILFPTDTGPHLELLTMVNLNLSLSGNVSESDGLLSVREVQAGTWRVDGIPADLQQTGAAYIYRAQYSCSEIIVNSSDCVKSDWVLEAKFYPTILPINSRYGYSVAITDSFAVIGAPGTALEQGYVYVYEYTPQTGEWSQLQIFLNPVSELDGHFGEVVAANGNTILVSAPGYADGEGMVYIYKRPSTGGTFIATQNLIPSAVLYPIRPGSFYGSSISIESNTVVVGSKGYNDTTAVYLGDTSSGLVQISSGSVFIFKRSAERLDFKFDQHLVPSNVRAFDQFGYSVDVDGNNLVVSSLEDSLGAPVASRAIMEVRTEATYNVVPVSGSFKIKWRFTNTSSDKYTLSTRAIPYNAAAQTMKYILEADLPRIGKLLVSRSNIDAYNGGYSWMITFLSSDSDSPVDLFQTDTSSLSGTNATVTIKLLNPTPHFLRGKAHLFQRSSFTSPFVEESFLSPYAQQVVDRCGESVAISGKYALVGCPHRDQSVPSKHSGAGFLFDLAPLSISFSLSEYTVTEGAELDVRITHNQANYGLLDQTAYFFVQTIDRNAPAATQKFLENLYGVVPSTLEYPLTVIDGTAITGKAIARSQFYGSDHNESQWVSGMYDYRAISDYVPIKHAHSFLSTAPVAFDTVITTKDTIFEAPDEIFSLAIMTPGVWPSVFGHLYAKVTILDGENGFTSTSGVSECEYRKLYDSAGMSEDQMGEVVVVNDDIGVMFSASPFAQVGSRVHAGKVVHYLLDSTSKRWMQIDTIESPMQALKGIFFGQSIAVGYNHGSKLSTLVIGEPGLNRVHTYFSGPLLSGQHYTYESSLSVPEAFDPQHRFGESVSVYGFLVAVGAPGLEAVYIFTRSFNGTSSTWYWSAPTKIVSSDYDYNIMNDQIRFHRQEFGKSVSLSERTLLVGSPFADYEKLGYDKPGYNLIYENWDTEGASSLSYGKGKAYVFYSSPTSQRISLYSPQALNSGQFRLRYYHRNVEQLTAPLSFDVSGQDLNTALSAFSNIDELLISVKYSEVVPDGFRTTWTITFFSDWQTPGKLEPEWYGFGCPNCTAFSSSPNGWIFNTTLNTTIMSESLKTKYLNATVGNPLQVQVEWINNTIGYLTEWQSLSSVDTRSGSRFGWAVSVDGEQLVVGAPYSSSLSGTSWDFEAGTLLGWSKTGSAFDFQPTYGDNSYYRASDDRISSAASFSATASITGVFPLGELRSRGVPSKLNGLYYIGTYEKRPGDSTDFSIPDPLYPEGNSQGDVPVGTLTSDVFIIYGSKIKFLIGGGCDIYKEYVELIVDGYSVAKQTGQCSEGMSPVQFRVSQYINRAAQIRIVDNGTSTWGHISVDQFQFDWPIDGGATVSNGLKTISGGKVETIQSGAAYVYRLIVPRQSSVVCDATMNQFQCNWVHEVKFIASDKRSAAWFGSAVAIDDSRGVLAVGAPGAPLTDFYKETPTIYPYINSTTGMSDTTAVSFPVQAILQPLFESQPRLVQQRSGASGVWTAKSSSILSSVAIAAEQAGAVYVYTKKHRKLSDSGLIIQPQYWYSGEQAKIQAPDGYAQDRFGQSIAMDNTLLVVGSPRQDGLQQDAGAAYLYKLKFASVSFSAVEYIILEGSAVFVTLTILRDVSIFDGLVVLEYATSDLTAKGIDEAKHEACMLMATADRGIQECGDYMQTAGLVRILPGDVSGGFKVNIVDDTCNENRMKYIQVTVSVPGSGALQSETLSTMIRIDDNDFSSPLICNMY